VSARPRYSSSIKFSTVFSSDRARDVRFFCGNVVEHAAENNIELLKERSLGVEVFGRDPNYDTNQDPVVRSTAGEVRKRLAQYYLESGHRDEIRISLPAGSYYPEIHPSPEKPVPAVAPAPAPSRRGRRWRWITASGIGVAAAAILFAPLLRHTDLDRFWAPVVEASSPAVVCVGQPKAYKFEPDTRREVETWIEKSAKGENPAAAPSIPVSGIRPVWDRYIALVDAPGDAAAVPAFDAEGKKVEIRGGRVSSLAICAGSRAFLSAASQRMDDAPYQRVAFLLRTDTGQRLHGYSGPAGRQLEGVGRDAHVAGASGSCIGLCDRFRARTIRRSSRLWLAWQAQAATEPMRLGSFWRMGVFLRRRCVTLRGIGTGSTCRWCYR